MRKNLVIQFVVAISIALASIGAHGEERAETLFNLVNLSAQAEREVANDTITAVLAVDTEGADPAALADAVNRAMREALKTAEGYRNVKARSLNYQTWPVYDKQRITRWRVRQELRLESRDFPQATELIGKLQSTLVVSGLTVGLSNEARKQAENALIVEALAAFHERAGIVRDAQKAKSYRVKDIQVASGGGLQPRMYAAQRGGAAAASVTAPSVEPGNSVIQINISGTVQLQ